MLRIGTKTAEFLVVCGRGERTLDERQFNILRGIFSACASDYWEFISPATFVAFFLRSEKGNARAQDLFTTLTELRKMMPEYENVHAARSEGALKANFTWLGKLRASPQGSAFDAAVRGAAGRSA
jgi:hypothetical protein